MIGICTVFFNSLIHTTTAVTKKKKSFPLVEINKKWIKSSALHCGIQ